MPSARTMLRTVLHVVAGGIVLALLYGMSRWNYLLFHSLVELFAVAVASTVFLIFWNSRRFLRNNCMLVLGIAYLFVAVLDLLHALAYKGMGVFSAGGSNLATQLWIAGRYVESLALLAAPLALGRRLRSGAVVVAGAVVTAGLLLAIFPLKVFPMCYVDAADGKGYLTAFKIASEFAVCAMLLAAMVLLVRRRLWFDRKVLHLLVASIAVTIGSELCFMVYTDVYGVANMTGHLLKLASFYLIYKALVGVSLTEPYNVLFRSLKESEEALRQSETRHRELVENLNEGIWVIDKDDRTSFVNPRMADMLGYTVEEMSGRHLFDFMDARSMEAATRNLQRRRQGIKEQHDFEFVRKDGSRLVATLETAPMFDHEGNYAGASAGVMDVTHRRQAEEEREALLAQLENEQARLQAIIRSAPGGIIVVDQDARVVMTNPAADRLYEGSRPWGYDSTDPAAPRVCYLDGRPYELDDLPLRRAALDGQAHANLEIALVWPDGERRDLLENTAPIRDAQGRLAGAVAVFQDISEEHQFRAELVRRTEQLETLVREAHHRIRNNLQSVISLLELERGRIDPAGAGSLDRCVSRIRAIAMVHRMLTTEATSSVPLQTLLKGLAELAQATYLGPDDTQIDIGVAGRNLAVTSKAATSLAIVVNELVSNALIHAFPDRGHGRINITVSGGDGRPVAIAVADDGRGCPQQAAEGTGLVLARNIVEHDLRGQFEIQSGDRGTQCVVRFSP